MTHEEYQACLDKLLDGKITAEEAAAMESHERECEACATLRAELERLNADLKDLGNDVPPMPEDLHEQWMADVRAEAKPQRKAFRWGPVLSMAAVAVLAVGVGIYATRPSGGPELAPAGGLIRTADTETQSVSLPKSLPLATGMPTAPQLQAERNGDDFAYEADTAMDSVEAMPEAAYDVVLKAADPDEAVRQLTAFCAEHGIECSVSTDSTVVLLKVKEGQMKPLADRLTELGEASGIPDSAAASGEITLSIRVE